MLTCHLDANSSIPLYEQIYLYIRQEIRSGALKREQKLPSTRLLANHLQISRNTVDLAYGQLLSEGYIESIPKRGYFVCKVNDLMELQGTKQRKKPLKVDEQKSYPYDFSPFAVDINQFPVATWRKLSRECMNYDNNDLFLLGERQGDSSFRQAIQQYLHDSRGVNCTKEQIIIGAGADYLLQLLAQLLPEKSKIAMENPTYRQAYLIFSGLGFPIDAISLTNTGMDLNLLEKSDCNICYVTPAHQYPVGIVMPYKQRIELLHWANQQENRYIIEDDHDSEFRYRGKPIPALAGLDTSDKVIYLGTFSRAIAPAIRIGYMVLPEPLLERYQTSFSYYASTVSRVDQAILTSFIRGGYFERHLNRMRKIYKAKHDILIQALARFGDEITIYNANAGLHLFVQFHGNYTEEELLENAQNHGIKLYSLKKHYITDVPTKDGIYLLLGFGNLTEEQIQAGIQLLYDSLHPTHIAQESQ